LTENRRNRRHSPPPENPLYGGSGGGNGGGHLFAGGAFFCRILLVATPQWHLHNFCTIFTICPDAQNMDRC